MLGSLTIVTKETSMDLVIVLRKYSLGLKKDRKTLKITQEEEKLPVLQKGKESITNLWV